MTNNQREFQRQVNRIQNELSKLTSKGKFTQVTPIPEQPKRVTRKVLTQLESINARHLVAPTDEVKTIHKYREEPPKGRIKKRNDYVVKGRRLKIVETPSERKTRKDKGTHLSDVEKANRLAKRRETLANKPKSNKPRKIRKDKGTHLSDIEKARRLAKRRETLAKKHAPQIPDDLIDNEEYAKTIDNESGTQDVVKDILARLYKAKGEIQENIEYTTEYYSEHKRSSVFKRMVSLQPIRMACIDECIWLVEANSNREDYYNLLVDRYDEIDKYIGGILQGSTEGVIQSAYSPLYELLSPTPVALPDKQKVAESSEDVSNLMLNTIEDEFK